MSLQTEFGIENPATLLAALRSHGISALFPPSNSNKNQTPAQPAMFLVYLCGTWIIVRIVVLFLLFFGAFPNPGFPWGFLHPVQSGDTMYFMELLLALLLILVVYIRFFYRYNDYLYHVHPTNNPLDFLLDCMVALSGVATIIAAGENILFYLSFASLFMFAGLKYARAFVECRKKTLFSAEIDSKQVDLWRLNCLILREKLIYDFGWVMVFLTMSLLAMWRSQVTQIVVFSVLIITQLTYLQFGNPASIAIRHLKREKLALLSALMTIIQRLFSISRPYTLAYVALAGLCGLLSGRRAPTPIDLSLSLSMGPLIWVAMLCFHDAIHSTADMRSGRQRHTRPWVLLPYGIAMLLVAVGLGAIAGTTSLLMIFASIVLGLLYGVFKGIPLLSNIVRGCVTAAGVMATGGIVGITEVTKLVAIGIGLIDSAGNILGDARDARIDATAGTKTIATISPRGANVANLVLFALSLGFLSIVSVEVAPLITIGFAIVVIAPATQSHLWFLMLKYIVLGIIGLKMSNDGLTTVVVVILFLLAVPSMIIYKHIHTPAGSNPNGSHR